jgi:hypothetical protein
VLVMITLHSDFDRLLTLQPNGYPTEGQ